MVSFVGACHDVSKLQGDSSFMSIGEFFAITAAFGIGLGSVLCRLLTFKLKPVPIQSMRALSGGIILVFVVIIMGNVEEYTKIPLNILALSLFAAIFSIAIGDAIYIKMLSMAPASKVCPVLWSLRIILVFIGEALFYREPMNWAAGIAALLIMIGVYLALSAEEAPSPQSKATGRELKNWLPLCLITGILWALYYLVMKYVLAEANAVISNPPMILNSLNGTVAGIVLCLFLILTGRGESLRVYKAGMQTVGILITTGILVLVVGMVLELYAIDLAGAARTSILVSWAPIFVMLLSGLILKEKITWRLAVGTVLCTGGTILLVAY